MTKAARIAAILAALLAALVIAGCGGNGSGSAVEDELTFMPKDAPIAGTVATDPDGGQWKQLDGLLSRFPFVGLLKQRIKAGIAQTGQIDFDRDIKPILGHEAVFAVPTVEAARRRNNNALVALKVDDEGKARDFLEKIGTKVGTFQGTDLYRGRDSGIAALDDGFLVAGPTAADVQAALARHDGSDHMTTDDLDARMAGLTGDALLKVGINAQQLIAASPTRDAARARRIKWIGALRDVGILVAAKSDGIELDFKTTSSSGLTDKDLPLDAGTQAAPVVRRADEVGVGLRNLTQVVQFAQSAAAATDPRGFGRYEARKAKAGVKLGIDIDRDFLSQFTGDATVSIGIDGSWALQSALRDAQAFERTLRTAAPRLPKASPRYKGIEVLTPAAPGGLYTLTAKDGRKYAFGVVDDKFVAGTDAVRATELAKQSPSSVPGAKGSLTLAADARALANAAAQRAGQGAAGLFTGALGDITGWIDTETSGVTGRLKLEIK